MTQHHTIEDRVPNIDRAWCDACIVELRLRGARGADIGAALLEVESHMAEHGGDVAQEFGPARDYAASLDLPDSQQFTRTEIVAMAVRGVLTTLGLWLSIAGVFAIARGEAAQVSLVAAAVLTGAVTVVTVVLARHSERILRWLLDHIVGTLLVVVAAATLAGGLAALAATAPGPSISLTGVATLLVGVVMIAAGALWWLQTRRSQGSDDAITFPVA